MCPSYRATGEEQHSTRGRAHLLWEMLAGAFARKASRASAVHEALDLCLSCKACKSECPVQVDMAAYKSEFLAQRYKGRLHPLHHYIFGFADRLARYGSLAPALTNAVLTGPLHQSSRQAHRRSCARAPTAASGAENLPKGDEQMPQPPNLNHRMPRFWNRETQQKRTAQVLLVARHLEQLLPPANSRRC